MHPRKNSKFPSREIPELVTGVGAAHQSTRPFFRRQVTTTGSSGSPYKGTCAPSEAIQRLLASIVILRAPRVNGLGAMAGNVLAVRLAGGVREGGVTAPLSKKRYGKFPA